MKVLTYAQWCKENKQIISAYGKRAFETGHQQGLLKASEHLERLATAYADEHGTTDPETGCLDFRSQSHVDYYNSLMELSEEIAALPIE